MLLETLFYVSKIRYINLYTYRYSTNNNLLFNLIIHCFRLQKFTPYFTIVDPYHTYFIIHIFLLNSIGVGDIIPTRKQGDKECNTAFNSHICRLMYDFFARNIQIRELRNDVWQTLCNMIIMVHNIYCYVTHIEMLCIALCATYVPIEHPSFLPSRTFETFLFNRICCINQHKPRLPQNMLFRTVYLSTD